MPEGFPSKLRVAGYMGTGSTKPRAGATGEYFDQCAQRVLSRVPVRTGVVHFTFPG